MYPNSSGGSLPSAGRPPSGAARVPAQSGPPPRHYAAPPQDETMQLRRVDAELADYLESLSGPRDRPAYTPPPRRAEPEPAEPEPETVTRTDASLMRLIAAVASLGAGAVHVAATPPHWEEWQTAGVFFAGIAAFQLLWGLVALKFGNAFIRVSALLANVGILGVWAWSRTQGMPFGPHAGVPEAYGLADLIAAALGVAVVAALGLSLLPRERAGSVSAGGYWAAVIVAFLAFGALAAQGSVSAMEHSHEHGSETGGGHGEDGHDDGHDHEHDDEADMEEPAEDEAPAEDEDHSHAPGEEHD